MDISADTALFNAWAMMVVPLRREFGLTFDVLKAKREPGYAREVLARAQHSSLPKVRECAAFVDSQISAFPVDEPAAAMAPSTTGSATGVAEAGKAATAVAYMALPSPRLAARLLIEEIGPFGEDTAIALERCRDPERLSELLQKAQDMVANMCGAAAAGRYLQRASGQAA